MIGSVQKAIKILNTISEGKNSPVSLSNISKLTGINKSTCLHIISTLAVEGFVKQISHTLGYVLGPAAYCLSKHGRYDNELVSVCHPLIRWLNKKTGFRPKVTGMRLHLLKHWRLSFRSLIKTVLHRHTA